MARKRHNASTVPESTVYENFVEQSEHLLDKAPLPPRDAKPDYPKILKVHINEMTDCDAFARLVRRTLRGDNPSFVFTSKSKVKPENWKFVDRRVAKRRKPKSSKARRESLLWTGMVDFKNKEIAHYTFEVTVRTVQEHAAFARLVKQQLSRDTKYLWFPLDNDEKPKRHWVSRFADVNPQYPVYIVSKGRADTRKTSRALERMGVPYFIVIEPQDYDSYACVIDKSRILRAPFSNHGDGPGRARNWCWVSVVRTFGADRGVN